MRDHHVHVTPTPTPNPPGGGGAAGDGLLQRGQPVGAEGRQQFVGGGVGGVEGVEEGAEDLEREPLAEALGPQDQVSDLGVVRVKGGWWVGVLGVVRVQGGGWWVDWRWSVG